MKYTQEQVFKHTKEYGFDVYISYVKEAQGEYFNAISKYTNSIGAMQIWGGSKTKEVMEDAHNFAINLVGLQYPPILCEQIEIYYKQQP